MTKHAAAIAELYGENAVTGPAMFIVGSDRLSGKARLGGTVLSSFATKSLSWERWRGTLIFIPQAIDVLAPGDNGGYWRTTTIQNMMLSALGSDDMWKRSWSKPA